MASGKQSALSRFAETMARQHGDKRAGPVAHRPVFVSTGVLSLDHALRRGGWPAARMVELVGPPDTGKTLIAITSMREQMTAFPDKGVAYIDMEKTFDYDWAMLNGLDCSEQAEKEGRWQHKHPMDSEDASDMARACCHSGLFSIVVVDSIGGMESRKAFIGPKDQLQEAAKELVANNAKVITRMVKHLAALAYESGTTILLVNQPRPVVGSTVSLPDTSAGPRAMQHATTIRVATKKGAHAPVKVKFDPDEDAETVAVQVEARITRSKLFPPGGTAEFWINNRATNERGPAGVDMLEEYVRIGLRTGVIRRNGAYYQIPTAPQVKSRENMVAQVREKPQLLEVIRQKIFEEQS